MFLEKLRNSLSKTHEKIVNGINNIFNRGSLDELAWEELETILLSADVGYETTDELIKKIKKEPIKNSEDLKNVLIKEVCNILSPYAMVLSEKEEKPYVIMVVGVNGVGKTTTIAKMGNYFVKKNKKVVVGAADTFRAAAIEQLQIWADRVGLDIVKQKENADPGAVAYDSLQYAISKKADVLIIDTAGRLHTKTNLMDELKKIKRVMHKVSPNYPHDVLLVLDATLGQNAISQAKVFAKAVNVTGLVMTKLDGTAKGGVLINIVRNLKLPVVFIGVGEKIDDLEIFDSYEFAQGLFR